MYKAKITREHRTAFIILCDRSGSMAEETRFGGQVMRKAEAVACIINMLLGELIHRSRRDDGIRDYFDIAFSDTPAVECSPCSPPATGNGSSASATSSVCLRRCSSAVCCARCPAEDGRRWKSDSGSG